MYDAKWSPIHPALFATVDGMGRLDLWNLNNDTEVCVFSTGAQSMFEGCIGMWNLTEMAKKQGATHYNGTVTMPQHKEIPNVCKSNGSYKY